ncbi:MAG TPA: hypothetical protein VIR59_06035 [Gaiellaceae bacterium]|jgi:hypothetical protein
MAGFVIAIVAAVLPFVLGALGLGRLRVLIIGGVLGFAWTVGMAATRSAGPSGQPPLWFALGLVVLLYAIWCGGLWLGARLRRLRHATPG